MVKINEVRFGNLFLTKEGGYFLVGHLETVFYYLDDLSPIPLSHEILEACGFKKGTVFFERGLSDGDTISFDPDDNNFWIEQGTGITSQLYYPSLQPQYLHQLQNLYWCLCGKELEVDIT